MSRPETITVSLSDAASMSVTRLDDMVTASIHAGDSMFASQLVCACVDAKDIRVARDADGVWFNDAYFPLSMANLLRVADFLHLDTPLPVLPAAAGANPALTPASAAAGTFVEAHA